jgi:hypothetical protein
MSKRTSKHAHKKSPRVTFKNKGFYTGESSENDKISYNPLLYTPPNMVASFLRILNIIKLFHWKTTEFSVHKATDELYSDLGGRIDAFVEQLMGITDKRIDINESLCYAVNCDNIDELRDHIVVFKKYLGAYTAITGEPPNMVIHFDLATLRDEMIGLLDKFLYLITLH